MSVPKNHPHVASGHTCLGLDEASSLSVSDTWKRASSRTAFVKVEKGEEGGRKRKRKTRDKGKSHQNLTQQTSAQCS